MNIFLNIARILLILYVSFSLYQRIYGSTTAEIPRLPETWWGPPASDSGPDKGIRPFRVKFSKEDIQDLKYRLKNTRRLTGALEGTGWTYGVDGSFLPTIIDYWHDEYNFTKREEYLNQYPQFIVDVQGLDMHFLHVKPSGKKVTSKRILPLLIQHGWPGSVVEFYKILPLLTTPRDEYDFVFEVVAPSLPGFGFSSAAVIPGLGAPQIAVVLKNLMLKIGFDKFYTQGGDWGAVTTAHMAALFPEHVLGMHSNMCVVLSKTNLLKTILYAFVPSLTFDKEDLMRMYPLAEKWSRTLEESGYFHIQATKPDTVGVGISDSPAALAAYVLEKFSTATNGSYRFLEDGGLLKKFQYDELIDNLMMYWIPNSMTTAMRIYAETFNRKTYGLGVDAVPITVPSACAQFPNEIFYQAVDLLRDRFKNLIRATRMPRGGHFAAFEEPELLANDVWESVAEIERLRNQNINKKPSKDL